MSIEQQYYENEEFWKEAVFANQLDRFELIASHIPDDARTLLDVGCGNGIFVNMLAGRAGRFDELHATDRSVTALKQVKTPKTQASIDALPFDDVSYDIVTSLEVIEHLPLGIYEAGLANICRIARKYVLLSVPNEEDLEASHIACPSCRTRFNPDYHMRSYDAGKMQSLLAPHGFRPRETFYMGGKKHYFMMTRLLERKADGFPIPVPCPVCGFVVPPGTAAAQAHAGGGQGGPATQASSGAKELVKSLLHTRTDYGWVATLYERV